jgi:hypothetical protein
VRDDMPRLTGRLPEDEVDVAATRDGVKRLDDDLRVRLENDERLVEEREGGVRARRGANRVALLDEVIRRRRGEVRRPVPDCDGALEDREVRPCGNDGGLVQQCAGGCRNQKECRGERGDECERTS